MARHALAGPDPMPLREALRGLRHLIRRGGDTLADIVPTDALPAPAATLAGALLRDARALAHGLDLATSGLAKQVLGRGDTRVPDLSGEGGGAAADARFAAALYAGLRWVTGYLGAPGLFISEAAACGAHARLPRRTGEGAPMRAAILTLDLLASHVLRGATGVQAARVPGGALEPVALFAVLLWMQADRPEGAAGPGAAGAGAAADGAAADLADAAALGAAADLALVLAREVATACAAHDAGRLAALYARHAPYV